MHIYVTVISKSKSSSVWEVFRGQDMGEDEGRKQKEANRQLAELENSQEIDSLQLFPREGRAEDVRLFHYEKKIEKEKRKLGSKKNNWGVSESTYIMRKTREYYLERVRDGFIFAFLISSWDQLLRVRNYLQTDKNQQSKPSIQKAEAELKNF